MPAGVDIQEIREKLAKHGYREIRLLKFDELIGGGRYVHVNRRAGILENCVTQFIPVTYVSQWSVWDWVRGLAEFRTTLQRSAMASAMDEHYMMDNDTNSWFVKPADSIGARPVRQRKFKAGEGISCTFDNFIGRSYGGEEPPVNITGVLNERHPPDPIAAAERQLRLTQEELRTREEEIRNRQQFSEVQRLLAIANEHLREGDYRRERFYREQAESVRRMIQTALDEQAQAARRGGLSNVLQNGLPGFDFQAAMRAVQEAQEMSLNPPAVQTMPPRPVRAPPKAPAPKVEEKPTGRRRILLDEDI